MEETSPSVQVHVSALLVDPSHVEIERGEGVHDLLFFPFDAFSDDHHFFLGVEWGFAVGVGSGFAAGGASLDRF